MEDDIIRDLDRKITLLEWDLQQIKDEEIRKFKFAKLHEYKHQKNKLQQAAML